MMSERPGSPAPHPTTTRADGSRRFVDRAAWRGTVGATALNVTAMPVWWWAVHRDLPVLSSVPTLLSLAVSGSMLLFLLLRRDVGLSGCSVLFTVHNAFILQAVASPVWLELVSNHQWQPFEPDKLGMLAVGLLMPFFPVGMLNILGFAAVAIIQYFLLPPNIQANLPAEPAATIAYTIFATGVLLVRVRQIRLEQRIFRQRAEHEARQLLLAVVNRVPIVLQAVDATGRIILSEGQGLRDIGGERGALIGANAYETFGAQTVVAPDGRRLSGREVLDALFAGRELRGDTPYRGRELEQTFVPLRDDGGRLVGGAVVAFDVTEQRTLASERLQLLERAESARLAAESAAERLDFLLGATCTLLACDSVDHMLEQLLTLVVPRFADVAMLYLISDDGAVRPAAWRSDPRELALVDRLRELAPSSEGRLGVDGAVETGIAQIVPDAPAWLKEHAMLDGAAALPSVLSQLQARAWVAVPLCSRGHVLGALWLLARHQRDAFAEDSVSLVEDLGRRAALVIDNARLYAEAQEALTLREDFLAAASHELRGPLTPLLISVEALRRALGDGELPSSASPLVLRMVRGIERQARRLRHLVDSMVQVAELQTGPVELSRSPVDLTLLTKKVCDSYHDALDRSGSSLALQTNGPLVGNWDQQQLELAISQLMSNAIKFGAGRPIRVRVDAAGDRARLTIADEGVGIAPELHSTIFDRFGRGVSTRSFGGLGLGLFLVRRIVDALGGTVAVDSAPGRGARFTVELPLAPERHRGAAHGA